MLNVHKQCDHVYSAHRVPRVVCEVNFGKVHMNNHDLYAHNPALIAVLVLGNNGHLSFTHTLQTGEQKILGMKFQQRHKHSMKVFTCSLTMSGDIQARRLKFRT